jgi:pimeloyl-ACP methyl ester carboxylesterase
MRIIRLLAPHCCVILLFAASLAAATINGIPLHSSTTGKGPATLVLVHGWTCDDRTWAPQVRGLSSTYRVITLDLPGHGRSGSPEDGKLSMDLFARAIEAVRAEQQAERIVLVGHSMGVITVMQYARMYPQHTAALVLVDGSVSMPPGAPREPMLAMAKNYGESLTAREAMVQRMFKPHTAPEVRELVLSMTSAVPPATPLAAMEALVDPSNWKEDVFQQPVLAVLSTVLDSTDPAANPEYMKARFPRLEYHRMAGTGHFLMLEKAEEFNARLRLFVAKLTY